MKAMILAAGRGERMRPLTDTTPKPLLSVGSQCLIERHLDALNHAGIREVVINISYHAKQLIDKLGDGKRYGVNILYSYEDQHPLGTGGGIYNALHLLDTDPFLLISADIWTELPFASLIKPIDGDAHLILVDNPSFHPNGDFCLEGNGQVVMGEPKLTYASIAIIRPALFANQSTGTYPLAPIFQEAIAIGKVTGEHFRGTWLNIGTPQQLKKLREEKSLD